MQTIICCEFVRKQLAELQELRRKKSVFQNPSGLWSLAETYLFTPIASVYIRTIEGHVGLAPIGPLVTTEVFNGFIWRVEAILNEVEKKSQKT